jgi:hypothetical protein
MDTFTIGHSDYAERQDAVMLVVPNQEASRIDACCVMRYAACMIKGFKYKGLEKFFTNGSTRGIQTNHSSKIRMQLAMLDASTEVDDREKEEAGF